MPLVTVALSLTLIVQAQQGSITAEDQVPYLDQLMSSGPIREDGTRQVTKAGWSMILRREVDPSITPQLMDSLLIPTGSIPSLRSAASWSGRINTALDLSKACSQAMRTYFGPAASPKPMAAQSSIQVWVWVFPNPAEAASFMQDRLFSPMGTQAANPTDYKIRGVRLPHAAPLADDYWVDETPSGPGGIVAREGRVVFSVTPSRWGGDALPATEAVARAVDFRILQHPELSGTKKPIGNVTLGSATLTVTTVNGVRFASLHSLAALGVQVTYHTDSATLDYGGKTVVVSAYGPTPLLAGPVFNYAGDLVVPIDSVARLLGISS